jgi:lipoyl(octanoyl) transferase
MSPVIYTLNLGLSEYQQALRLQYALHAHCRRTGGNVLVLTQHEPVVTLGYRRPRAQLHLSAEALAAQGIAVVEVGRGGGATYHGPGQLVAYAIFSSLARSRGIRRFVTCLEEVMLRVSQACGVRARRTPGLPGIWVGERKLGAVGIAVRGGVSLHGWALNVNLDLLPFSYIVPCGVADKGVTSLEQERGTPVSLAQVVEQTYVSFATIFAAAVKEMPDECCCLERTTWAGAVAHH